MSSSIYTTQRDFGGLGSVLPQIGTMLGEALGERRQRSKNIEAYNQLKEMFPEDSTLGKIFSNPDIAQSFANNGFLSSILTPLVKEENLQNLLEKFKAQRSDTEEISPEELVIMEQLIPGSSKIYQQSAQAKKEETAKAEDKERLQGSVDEMVGNLEYTGPLKLAQYGKPEVREQRQYFDSLAMNLEEIAATMVGKGTLSKPRFEFLLKNLPSSRKTQAANRGALKAWSKTLGINFPDSQGKTAKQSKPAKTEEIKESVTVMETMPTASEHRGKIIRNTENGKRYRSDGKNWKEVK